MLEGQTNFRDLGGYRTSHGSLVVGCQVFRSGDLSALTDRDLRRLEELAIRTVVDLRSEPEVEARPDRLPGSATYRALRVLPAVDNSTMEEMFRTGDFRSFPSWETIYRSGIREHSAVFSSLIRLVADPDNRPLVFHCATGKDRTGIGAALLLSILGVDWADVEEDYLLSNDRLGPFAAGMVDRIAQEMAQSGRELSDDARAHLEHMMLVDASYLAAAHDEMVTLDGSVKGYLAGTLGIDNATSQALRDQLLR
jgi:protein-tyrosine phosphatase